MVLSYLVIKLVNVHSQLVTVISSSSCTVVWTRLIDEATHDRHDATWYLSLLCVYYLAPTRTPLSSVKADPVLVVTLAGHYIASLSSLPLGS